MKKVIGFTLIELLIVIVIIGILASIAYPSYQSHLLKTRRADAKMELIKAQLKQTAFHILNPTYSNDESTVGLVNSDYYTFTVISAGKTTYSMKAVAKGRQIGDSGCTTLTINHDNHQVPLGCW
jgi:type IV pilus assembly protein PilE